MKGTFTLLFVYFSTVIFLFAQPNEQNNDADKNDIESNKPFEGYIKFAQITLNDTSYYTYRIKGDMVRLDIHENCENCKEAENCMLFDLEKEKITALKPSKKLFIDVPPKPYVKPSEESYKIIKSNNNKRINGYKCYQWRVRNRDENTEIAYWVANDNFRFFEKFLKLWNRSEKHANYYLMVPETIGYFPMLSVERTTLRDLKMKLKVVDIIEKEMDQRLFEIPENFKNYNN